MLLTRHTDHAVRLLMYAALNEDRAVSMSEVAKHFQVSRNHLKKIVVRLSRGGYVHTIRGKTGGVRLAMAPREINIQEVVRHMEARLEIIDCDRPRCPISGNCVLKRSIMEARDCFLEALGRYTLADLVDDRAGLTRLLGIAPASRSGREG